MSVPMKPEKIITIPNILSFIRILLVPVFAVAYLCDFENHFWYAIAVLLASGFSDVLDGFIARKFNMISTFGKILDPIADKLTQGIVVVCLAIRHIEIVFILILIFAKELTMLLGAVVLFKAGLRPSESKWWGKLSTVMVFVMFVVVLATDVCPSIPLFVIILTEVIAAICVLFSLFNYYPIFKEIQSGEYDIEKEQIIKNDE